MPEAATYVAFLAALVSTQLVPGPETMLVLSRGIGEGRRIAVWTVFGMTIVAGAVQLPLLALGVASVMRSSPIAFDLLRWIGAAYLVGLGTRLLFARGDRASAGSSVAPASSVSAWRSVRDGLVANLTNPHPLIFMLAFLPQYVDPARGSIMAQLLMLGATQKVTGFAVLGGTAIASGAVGGWLARRPDAVAWQQRLAGALIIAVGLRLVATASVGSP